MSHIETITRDLAALAAGIDHAQTSTQAVDRQAEEVAARAARAGFAGIAAGIIQVRPAIRELQTRLATVRQAIQEATAGVTAAPREMSPEQTIGVLSPVTDKLTTIRSGVAAAIDAVSDTQRQVAAALRGGQPGPLLTALDGIKQILAQVAQRCAETNQHVETAITEARQIGKAGK
jgi:prefoldin subunit 5